MKLINYEKLNFKKKFFSLARDDFPKEKKICMIVTLKICYRSNSIQLVSIIQRIYIHL
jgi:hypothetical protein